MTISDYIETFYSYPIFEFEENKAIDPQVKQAYRIYCEYDDKFSATQKLDQLLAKVPHEKIEAIVLGSWLEAYESSPQEFIDKLIEHASTLVNLKALFIGDMTYEDCEISWIIQGSYKALLEAYPQLEALYIRGATDLDFAPVTHNNLKELVIQSGGLSLDIPENIAASNFPRLTHLELWLGDDNYGFEGTAQDYKNIINDVIKKSPNLKYLGLRNSLISDKLAIMLCKQEWLAQLDTLDLSMGTLGDQGAQALLDSPYIQELRTLNLEHHFMSNDMMEKIAQLPIEVNLNDQQEEESYGDEDTYRYVSVSE